LRNPIHFLAFGCGAGAAPIAPGTVGTLVGAVIYYFLQYLPLTTYLLITLLGFFIGIWLCGKTSLDIKVHDHSGIVFDEIIGYLLTMLAAPHGLVWLVIGFLLFRFFDIVKPWPIRFVDQNVTGGLGIMLDDVLAAIYAGISLHLLKALSSLVFQ
jgi:phosphatidylglycerophosphatase A